MEHIRTIDLLVTLLDYLPFTPSFLQLIAHGCHHLKHSRHPAQRVHESKCIKQCSATYSRYIQYQLFSIVVWKDPLFPERFASAIMHFPNTYCNCKLVLKDYSKHASIECLVNSFISVSDNSRALATDT